MLEFQGTSATLRFEKSLPGEEARPRLEQVFAYRPDKAEDA